MLLARTVEKTVHVNQMLREMEPGEFDAWVLEYQRRPWGDELAIASIAVATIINEIRGQLNGKEADLLPLDFLVPKDEQDEPEVKPMRSLQRMRSLIGV